MMAFFFYGWALIGFIICGSAARGQARRVGHPSINFLYDMSGGKGANFWAKNDKKEGKIEVKSERPAGPGGLSDLGGAT